MQQESRVKHQGAERVAPQSLEPHRAGFRRIERDQAERVVEQMGAEEGEQHQAAEQLQPPIGPLDFACRPGHEVKLVGRSVPRQVE
jgi:hypothetical protein